MHDFSEEPFEPRSPIGKAGEQIGGFFDRYLSYISIVVAALGVILLALGPVRGWLGWGGDAFQGGASGAGQSEIGLSGLEAGEAGDQAALNREYNPYTIIPAERSRGEVTTYTVQEGDTLFGISSRFNIDPNTIFWANSDILGDNVHTLIPGVELYILPVDGVYHRATGEETLSRIASEYEASADDLLNSPYNDFPDDADTTYKPNWGTRIVVPGGQREIVDYEMPVIKTYDPASGTTISSFMPGMPGSCARGIAGGGGTGAWGVPMDAYTFTQGFYPGHSGVDLAAPTGAPVRAADGGVVIFSGWVLTSWGYGILVVLDHGGGWTTYYAHLSSNGVSCGQMVSRGAYIGAVGSTGNSSGPHLHFEMRWYHTPDNPTAYIGF